MIVTWFTCDNHVTKATPTCQQHLVSGHPLHSLQHVAGEGEVGTLGLGLELAHHGRKDGILLDCLFQRLQGFIEPADVVSVQLMVECTCNRDQKC